MRLVTASLALPLILSACSSTPDRGGSPGIDREGRNGPPVAMSLSQATVLVEQGEYARALPILRCMADQGSGFEIAQYLAGYATVRQADAEETPQLLAPELILEGLQRLEIAAQAGWPSAQAELAMYHWEAGTAEAMRTAAYWATVYRHNPRDRALGVDRLSPGLEAQIHARLPEHIRQQIEAEADAFVITPMEARETTPQCTQMLNAGRAMMRQNRTGMSRSNGRGGPGGGSGGRPPR